MRQHSTFYAFSTGLVASIFAIIFSVATASAEGPVTLEGEPDVTIGHLSSVDFNVSVRNDGFVPMQMYVVREVNGVPDESWFSTICMGELCYDGTVSKSDVVTVQPGETYKVKFTVYTGEENASGTFKLRVVEIFGGDEEDLGTLDFSVAADDITSVIDLVPAAGSPYPMPAFSSVTIPLTNVVGSSATLLLYDASGSVVSTVAAGDLVLTNDGILLDVTGLKSGAYFYALLDGESTRSGQILVQR